MFAFLLIPALSHIRKIRVKVGEICRPVNSSNGSKSVSSKKCEGTHTLLPGESAASLVAMYSTKLSVLEDLNRNMNLNNLGVGDKVKVPLQCDSVLTFSSFEDQEIKTIGGMALCLAYIKQKDDLSYRDPNKVLGIFKDLRKQSVIDAKGNVKDWAKLANAFSLSEWDPLDSFSGEYSRVFHVFYKFQKQCYSYYYCDTTEHFSVYKDFEFKYNPEGKSEVSIGFYEYMLSYEI